MVVETAETNAVSWLNWLKILTAYQDYFIFGCLLYSLRVIIVNSCSDTAIMTNNMATNSARATKIVTAVELAFNWKAVNHTYC